MGVMSRKKGVKNHSGNILLVITKQEVPILITIIKYI